MHKTFNTLFYWIIYTINSLMVDIFYNRFCQVYFNPRTQNSETFKYSYVLYYHMINKNILKRCYSEGFTDRELYNAYKIFFGTLVSESRLKIINLLREKIRNVSEIIKELKISQTLVSHDLQRLKKCGFVSSKQEGKFIYYKLNEKTIKPLIELIDKHMSCYCIHILKENKRRKIK